MKNIYLVAAALAVFAFSACSDDKDDTGVCYAKVSEVPEMSVCVEGKSKSLTADDCAELSEGYNEGEDQQINFKLQDSCSSGEDLKCPFEEDGEKVEIRFYSQLITMLGMTCEDLEDMM